MAIIMIKNFRRVIATGSIGTMIIIIILVKYTSYYLIVT